MKINKAETRNWCWIADLKGTEESKKWGETPSPITGATHRESPTLKNSRSTIEGMAGNGRSPTGWRQRKMRETFYDRHWLGKFGQQGGQTWRDIWNNFCVNFCLPRDDRDKMPSILQKMKCKRAGGRNRKTVTCTAVIQTFILGKIFSYSHHL